jgi:PAS domain S-box-containing protein
MTDEKLPPPGPSAAKPATGDVADSIGDTALVLSILLATVSEIVAVFPRAACIVRLVGHDALYPAVVFHPDLGVSMALRRGTASRPRPLTDKIWGPFLHAETPVTPGGQPFEAAETPGTGKVEGWCPTCQLGAPVIARGRPIGAVCVMRDTPFTKADESALANLLARATQALDAASHATEANRASAAAAAARAEAHEERTRAAAAVAGSELRFRQMSENIRDLAILLLDDEGRIRSWNVGAEHMTGWRASEMVGEPLEGLYGDDERQVGAALRDLERTRATGLAEGEGWRQRKDGAMFWAHWVLTAVQGEGMGFVLVCRDLTEERAAATVRQMNKLLEARTAELAAANEELDAFSYSISHDLQAPLRAIDGFSEALLLDHGSELNAEGRELLNRVRGAAGRMRQLIADLLSLSRVSSGMLNRAEVDLARIAREVVDELQAQDRGRQVELTAPPQILVSGDSHLLHIALENLLANAWKFTRGRPIARITLEATRAENQITVTLRDNGAGFDMAQSSRLFQPFQRLHRPDEFEGTGIGLAIVRRIVHRHGGRAWAEGEPGVGAAVHFTLPVMAPPADVHDEDGPAAPTR